MRLFFGGVFLVAFVICVIHGALSAPEKDEDRNARDEVVVINLLNGLELSDEQAGWLLTYAKEAEKARREFLKSRESGKGNMDEALDEVKSEAENGKNISDAARKKYAEAHRREKETEIGYFKKMEELAELVKSRLESYQIEALKSYKPCVIPPKEGNRIGQADSGEKDIKHVEQVRALPQKAYDTRKEEIAQRFIQRIKYHFMNPNMDEEDETDFLIGIYDRARKMNDVEFELNKGNLAGEIAARYDKSRNNDDVNGKIMKILLSDAAVDVLEKRVNESPLDKLIKTRK
ncbi:MAG: hypothetical protein JW728_03345 [Candidatus Aureabacteria bacterium]|nr:hypothetical protein [Candidatus Auribacterota bacterium]